MKYEKSQEVIDLEKLNLEKFDIEELYMSLPKEERAHAMRVSLYGSLLYRAAADKNSYPEDKDLKKIYVKFIADAFRYHDIGKAVKSIDPKFKGGENTIKQQHPAIANSIFGYLMKDYDELSRDKKLSAYIALEAAVGHHENWNGTGFPEKKKEIGISIYGRICKIVNEYDHFIFENENSHSDAVKKLIRGKGTKYDPILVDVFKSIDKQILEVSNYFNEERSASDKPSKIYNDENIANMLLGKKGRIRNGMKYNADLFTTDNLRPIELLFNRVVNVDSQMVPFIEAHVIVNSDIEGTLFPADYEMAARKSDRFEKLNKWGFTEVSLIHESWEVKFQRDVKYLMHLSVNTLLGHESVSDFTSYLSMLNIDNQKVAFEINIDDLADKEDEDIEEINQSMSFLKNTYGYEFVLNGINPTYPSYDILMQYDFNYLKVDYRLYRNYSNRQKVLTLIEKLGDMCKDLGTMMIVTNIREKGEAKLVNECGISLMSGPYFGELIRIPTTTFFKVNMLE